MRNRDIPIIMMGLSSILLQITALRQLISVFSGNELDIGITLSVWLTAVGIGSYAGHRLKGKNALALSFLVIAFLSQTSILFMNLIRPLFSVEFGETMPLTTTVISTVISLMPLCLAIGIQFPLAVSYSEGGPSRVYSLEALGGFAGGAIFTWLLSSRVDAVGLTMGVSILNIILALLLLRKRSLSVLLLVPIIFYFGTNKINTMLLWKGAELIGKVESRYGEITELKLNEQINIFSSGKFRFSYPDPQSEELKVHLPMSIHPSPHHILVIGGSPALLREFLKYPIKTIDFVEIDPEMIRVSLGLLNANDREILHDRRVSIITKDARRFVKSLHTPEYDFIILNLPEPATADINRFYTTDFFKEAGEALKEDGIFSLNLLTSSGYISRRMQTANGSIYNSLKTIFEYVNVSSEEYGYIFASKSPLDMDAKTLAGRFSKRGITTTYFRTYILDDAFSPLKVRTVEERLEKIEAVNSDLRPIAYLYNLAVWADVHGGKVLNYLLDVRGWQMTVSIVAVFLIAAVVLWSKRQAVYYSMFTTGYSSMSFSMVLILTYQASFGYIYEMIGFLTALFMLGTAFGAQIITDIKRPFVWLRFFEVAAIVLFLSSPLFLKQEYFFYILILLCGIIGGIQFATTNLCIKEQEIVRGAGIVYAVDLAGSFSGAFLTTIFLMPLLGVYKTLLSLVSIKAISFVLLLSVRDEKI